MRGESGGTLRDGGDAFQLLRLVASGGFGSVYFGLDFATNEPVAIKLLHPHHAHDARVVERFRREAALVRDLDHPNVSPW